MLAPLIIGLALGFPSGGAADTEARSERVCSAEQAAVASSQGAQLAYRDLGPSDGRPVLLIGGTDQQMTQWPASLLEAMRTRGLRPIVYDARDVGCSTHHSEAGPADWPAIFGAMATGGDPALPYDLETLAADAVAVLDDLGLASASIVGVSGGATVAGEVAAAHPDRVDRLVLLMANSGNPALPMPADPARMARLPPPPPMGADAAVVAAYRVAAWRALDGEDVLTPPETYPAMADAATARSWDSDGIGRAGAPLLTAGDRRARLAAVESPTLVIHGETDPLISVEAGREVARAIPDARFVSVPKMGHSLTPSAVDALLEGLDGPTGDDRD